MTEIRVLTPDLTPQTVERLPPSSNLYQPKARTVLRREKNLVNPVNPVKKNNEDRIHSAVISTVIGRILHQIPEQSGHYLQTLSDDGRQQVFVGSVLATAAIGMGHPDGRQA